MKQILTLIVLPFLCCQLAAEDRMKLIFQDSFDRSESDEAQEEVGNGWGTNSKTRANGNKQVDLKDGAMHIYIHKTADHAVSVRHEAEFQNGTVEIRFMLEHPQDTLGLNFADLKLKTVHAGHLFKVTIGKKKLEISDLKTGPMEAKIHAMKKAGKLTPEIKKVLATKKKIFPCKLEAGKWHGMTVNISGDKVSVTVNGKEAGEFSSEGFAHPTKRMLRLSVPRQAYVDDLKIYSTDE